MLCSRSSLPNWSVAIALFGAVVLAIEPSRWLVTTWFAPENSRFAVVVFVGVVLLVVASLCSGPPQQRFAQLPVSRLLGVMLLTAGLRLLSQLLDIDVVGALLLAVDIYVLARFADLQTRPLPLHPLWLALLFCFCLPVEIILQRLLGYPLQLTAAFVAYAVLFPFISDLALSGVRLFMNSRDVLVDLPCSGSTLLLMLAAVWTGLNALNRPSWRQALGGGVALLLLAIIANGVRVALLAVGIGYHEWVGFDVMQPIPHNAIGLLTSGLAAWLLIRYRLPSRQTNSMVALQTHPHKPRKASLPLPLAGLFAFFALGVSAIQPQPVDASPLLNLPQVPTVAAGFLVDNKPLSPLEKGYFQRYGGAATRASYGPYGLLVVTTQSPLRHLHDPAVCFRGMGYAVQLVGSDFAQARTVYRVQDPQTDQSFLLYVSYQGPSGTVLSIAEVVWHWVLGLRNGGPGQWTMVQRIVPVELAGSSSAQHFEAVVKSALEL